MDPKFVFDTNNFCNAISDYFFKPNTDPNHHFFSDANSKLDVDSIINGDTNSEPISKFNSQSNSDGNSESN